MPQEHPDHSKLRQEPRATPGAATISDDYRSQQIELHKNPDYGVASLSFAPIIKEIMEHFGVRSISDYGAGKKNLLRGLNDLGMADFDYFPYDPAFPEYGPPRSADLVCCIDVLEHVEPPFLGSVLKELRGLTVGRGFFSIHCGAAAKRLLDGRNAHLIQKPSLWWLPRLCEHFEIRHLESAPGGF